MSSRSRREPLLCGALAAVSLSAACGGAEIVPEVPASSDVTAPPDLVEAPDASPSVDTEPLIDVQAVADSVSPDGEAAELSDDVVIPTDLAVEDVIVRPTPGRFVQASTGLSEDWVFKGVWAGVAGYTVAVGNDGVIATQAGLDAPWEVVARGDASLLNAVHGAGIADLWAVGSGATILPGAAEGFRAPMLSGGGTSLWDVHALTPDLAVAVGQGGAILQWDGLAWQRPRGADSAASWNAISGYGSSLAFVGNDGVAAMVNGAGFASVTTGTTRALNGVHLTSETSVVAVGDSGVLLVGEGLAWRREETGLGEDLRDVHGVPGDLWIVGEGGALLHDNGDGWALMQGVLSGDFHAVWRVSDEVVLAAGANGQVVELGSDTPRGYAGTLGRDDLLDLWATSDGGLIVAVGQGGAIFTRRSGGAWEAVDAGTSQTLDTVWGSGPDDVWVAGRAGTLVHFDGTAWTRVETPSTAALNGLWGDARDRFYLAGSGGTVLVWDGEVWAGVTGGTTNNLRSVFLRSAVDGWAVGAQGTVLRFRGLGWAKTPVMLDPETELADELHAVWSFSGSDAWAVGAGGRVIRWDGTAWAVVETPWTVTLRGLYGQAPDDLWAVGNEGQVIHWNGETWQRIETGSVATLHAVHGDGADHVVLVGSLGTVMRLERPAGPAAAE
jgi:hypothetical protein